MQLRAFPFWIGNFERFPGIKVNSVDLIDQKFGLNFGPFLQICKKPSEFVLLSIYFPSQIVWN